MKTFSGKIREIEAKTGLIIDLGVITGTLRIRNPKDHNGFVFFLLAMSLENDLFFKLEDDNVTFSTEIIKLMVEKDLKVL